MATKIPESVSEYMARIGRKGGKNGKGVKKRRAPEHYAAAGKASGKRRRKKSQEI